MVAIFAAARGLVVKRTRADWLIVAAASLIILLATTLLSAGMIYAGAVSQSGLQRTLTDAAVPAANLEVSGRIDAKQLDQVDGRLRDEVAAAFGSTGAGVLREAESDSFGLPNQVRGAGITDLAVLASFQQIAEHARTVQGSWPVAADGPVQVAVSRSAASQRGLSVGDEVALQSRRDPTFRIAVRVVGIFEPNDPNEAYWWDSPLLRDGLTESAAYRTYGPFVADERTFLSRVAHPDAQVRWHIFPRFAALQIDEIDALQSTVTGLNQRLRDSVSPQLSVETSLDDILAHAERSLLVARTGVLILTVQLAVLAGYALLLTAGLLIEQRRVETALLRSRGASTAQVASLALMEGVLLAVPAVLIGPWLAAASLGVLNAAGPLAAISLKLEPQVTLPAYLLAAIAGLACIVALVVPAFSAARSFVSTRQSSGRQEARGIAQRVGLDLALLVVAAIGFWQLRHYGGTITASVQGQLGLDPFLVAAPALGLLAGAVLALRLIPLLAQLIEHAVGRTRGLVSSLGAWQVARRPQRYTRSALLLMLAIALGVFAVSYTGTWTASQGDQADYQVGADVAVTPDRRAGSAIPQAFLAGAYAGLGGVRASMPLLRQDMRTSGTAGNGMLLALDASVADRVVRLRPDLSAVPFRQMMNELASRRPKVDLPRLAGTPQRLRVSIDLRFDIQKEIVPRPSGPQISAAIVIRDARGMLYRLVGEPLPPGAGTKQLVIPLAKRLADDSVATPQYPLELAAIEVEAASLDFLEPTSQFVVSQVAASPSLDGHDWTTLQLSPGAAGWQYSLTPRSGGPIPSSNLAVPGRLGMHLTFNASGQPIDPPFTYAIQPASLGAATDQSLAIIGAGTFLNATDTKVGDRTAIDLGSGREQAQVIDALDAFPTLAPDSPLAIADLPSLALFQYRLGGITTDVDEWWLAVDPSRDARVVAALADAPYNSFAVSSRIERARALRTDPVALGVIGALSLGFVSAALFASIGFVVSASVSARERLTEFALLRALGLSPGQLSGWLSLENGLLVAISLIGGTGLGLLMSWVALPFVTVTGDASAAVPGVIVTIPWTAIGLLEGITVAVLGLMVIVLATLLRRIGLGSALRLGDE